MPQPVLLIASPSIAVSVADALRSQLDLAIETAVSRREALACLRRSEYAILLIDEMLVATDTEGTDALYAHAGAAPVLEVNFAITGVPRIVRQIRSTLSRRNRDLAQARADAATRLQSELGSSLAGLLLECELALREAAPAQQDKLRHMVELAGDLRERLRAQ